MVCTSLGHSAKLRPFSASSKQHHDVTRRECLLLFLFSGLCLLAMLFVVLEEQLRSSRAYFN